MANVVLTPNAFRKIKDAIRTLERQHKNLLQRLHRLGSQKKRIGRGTVTRLYLGKTDGAINKGASGTVSIWDGPEGEEEDTDRNMTGVYNRFANIGSGKWVIFAVFRGRKYIVAPECPLT